MDAAMFDRSGTSPRLLLWNSIARTAKGAYAPLFNMDHGCSSDEVQDNCGVQEKPRGCNGVRRFLEENALLREVEEGPVPSVPINGAAVPRTVSMLVAMAHRKQPASLVYWARNECTGATAELAVGSDGLLSASVAGSLRCLHVRLQGLHALQRYFVAVDVQLDCERDDPSRYESASYLVPKPNHLDGLGWAHSPLTLDLATVLRERSQRASFPKIDARHSDIRYLVTARILPLADDFWPSGEEPVLIPLKEGSLQELVSGKGISRPGSFPSHKQDLTCQGSPWEADALHLTISAGSPSLRCGLPLEQARLLPHTCSCSLKCDVRPPLFFCQGSTLGEQPPAADPDHFWESSDAPRDAGAHGSHAIFYRDLDAEASLRMQHLELQRASSEGPSQQRWCSGDEDKLLQFGAGGRESTLAKWADENDSFNTDFKF